MQVHSTCVVEGTKRTPQILRRLPLKYYTLYGISVFGIRTADLSYSVYIMHHSGRR
jgi:hypothetical protein